MCTATDSMTANARVASPFFTINQHDEADDDVLMRLDSAGVGEIFVPVN